MIFYKGVRLCLSLKGRKGNTLMGEVSGGGSSLSFTSNFFFAVLVYYWGCARGFGRGTLYMKWGQGNQRFATMRLRGEKDEEKRKRERGNKML